MKRMIQSELEIPEYYALNEPQISSVKVMGKCKCNEKNGEGLGQLPELPSVGNWVTPVVIIVVSAMAFITLYAIITRR